MNIMRKYFVFTLLIVCCFLKSNAQYTIEYIYDNAGNRTHRTIIPLTTKAPDGNQTETNKTVESILPATEQLGDRKVEVFPNPTKGRLLVRITGGKQEETYSFILYNSTGIQIYEGKLNGSGDFPIEMEQYSNGIYILLLKTDKEKLSYKIIKE